MAASNRTVYRFRLKGSVRNVGAFVLPSGECLYGSAGICTTYNCQLVHGATLPQVGDLPAGVYTSEVIDTFQQFKSHCWNKQDGDKIVTFFPADHPFVVSKPSTFQNMRVPFTYKEKEITENPAKNPVQNPVLSCVSSGNDYEIQKKKLEKEIRDIECSIREAEDEEKASEKAKAAQKAAAEEPTRGEEEELKDKLRDLYLKKGMMEHHVQDMNLQLAGLNTVIHDTMSKLRAFKKKKLVKAKAEAEAEAEDKAEDKDGGEAV